MSFHEPVKSYRSVLAGSNRIFGLTFSLVFFVVSIWPWFRHGEDIRFWALGVSLTFLGLALAADHLLSPLNRLWFKFGMILHSVISPAIMAILFYGAVTPMAVILRLVGKDLLRLSPTEDHSYWINREPPGPKTGSMKNQF